MTPQPPPPSHSSRSYSSPLPPVEKRIGQRILGVVLVFAGPLLGLVLLVVTLGYTNVDSQNPDPDGTMALLFFVLAVVSTIGLTSLGVWMIVSRPRRRRI